MAKAVTSTEWYEVHPEHEVWWLRRDSKWVAPVNDERLRQRLSNTAESLSGVEPTGLKAKKVRAAKRAARQKDGV